MKPKIETALAYMMGVVALVALIAWCAALTIAPLRSSSCAWRSSQHKKRPHPMDRIGQGQKREGALLASIIQEV